MSAVIPIEFVVFPVTVEDFFLSLAVNFQEKSVKYVNHQQHGKLS